MNVSHLPKLLLCFFPGKAIPYLLFRFLPFDGIFGRSVCTGLTNWTPSGNAPKLPESTWSAVKGGIEVTEHGKFGTKV